MARSIGADHVIDYRQDDFTASGQPYNLILAVNGYHPMPDYKKALSPKGSCVIAGGELAQIFQSMLLGPLVTIGSGKRIIFQGVARTPKADLLTIRELLEAGKINPIIDKAYPLGETADAFRYILNEHAQGKVIITV
jgi:NADPH:quinone reductase-like Zn-dependent oxidoreductase